MAQFYTLEEAARVLGMSAEELKVKAQSREVRAFLDGGSWRFRVVDVDELARRRGLGSDAELRLSDLEVPIGKSGSGEMEEIRYSRNTFWRWTARLGDYSQVRVFQYGVPYDEKTPGPIPLRVQMVRSAVIWPMANVRPGTRIRMASAQWHGTEVMCALLSFDEPVIAVHGRHWEEREYCVDTKSALLRIYSEAPGIYTVYDYNDALHFHGGTLAQEISIVESGDTVLQIHVESLADAGAPDPALFTPTKEMLARGPGIVLVPSVRIPVFATSPAGHAGKVEPVIVHASVDDQGKVVEAETLQNSDPSLSNAALSLVRSSTYPPSRRATGPVQTEAFINVEFGAGR